MIQLLLIPLFIFSADDIWTIFEWTPEINDPLKDIRLEANRFLEQDLMEWEAKWHAFTPEESFARFVSDKPDAVQGVFWDSFRYMESKVFAGRSAYSNAMQNGASIEEARQAYFNAAAMPRDSLITANEQFNIKHGLADISEQRMFENGKYKLREN